jgi:hypothetical protein
VEDRNCFESWFLAVESRKERRSFLWKKKTTLKILENSSRKRPDEPDELKNSEEAALVEDLLCR